MSNNKGFTLIELCIAMTVLAIISTGILPVAITIAKNKAVEKQL